MISPVSETIEFLPDDDVVVFFGDLEGTRQPETFQCCPLGVQLYVPKPVPECEMIELKFSIPVPSSPPIEVNCTGMVAQCCACTDERPLYRVWVQFLDLDPAIQERIRVLTTSRQMTCPFCRNF